MIDPLSLSHTHTQMFKLFHEIFHIVDDHNELRQGECAMADVWLTKDWSHRHFAEGLGIWEVNVYKALVHFQGCTWNHNEYRKRLAHALLTLGKHTYGEPFDECEVCDEVATPQPASNHKLTSLTELTGVEHFKRTCGYCGTPSAYHICTICFPDVQTAKYAICSTNTNRPCFAQHCAGVAHMHTIRPIKLGAAANEAQTRAAQAEKEKRAESARQRAKAGGQTTQARKKSKSAVGSSSGEA